MKFGLNAVVLVAVVLSSSRLAAGGGNDDPLPGDTCANAIPVGLPATYTGTTTGFNNDYDEVCPYGGSTAPDVVYSFVSHCEQFLFADLCASDYDTKVYVYEDTCVHGTAIACNDDATECANDYRSYLVGVPMLPGHTYFIVVDGYGASSGTYTLDLWRHVPCVICNPTEGEPLCGPDYVDTHNGGCNSSPHVFQPISCGQTICGQSGTFTHGSYGYRDTDWFEITTGVPCVFEWSVLSVFPLRLFVIRPDPDCSSIVYLTDTAFQCEGVAITTECWPPGTYWFWVGPDVFSGVNCGSKYEATLYCTPCTPEGACCRESGCTVMTEAACSASEGTYAGDFTTCDLGGDCNTNGIADVCDILGGQSLDWNENWIPDECETPPLCRGDCNCDGSVDFADIDLFVAAIPNNEANWRAKHQLYYGVQPVAGCWENCDVNGVGTHAGFDDIDPFVALIPSECGGTRAED